MVVLDGVALWSAETDTLPHLRPAAAQPDRLDVVLTVGTWSRDGRAPAVEVEVWVDGHGRIHRVGEWDGVEVARVPEKVLADVQERGVSIRYQHRPIGLDEIGRWYVDMARDERLRHNRYYELVIPDVPVGAWLEYRCRSFLDDAAVATTCGFGMYVAAPSFGREDLVSACTPGGADQRPEEDARWWVLFHHADATLHHFRVDYLTPAHCPPDRPDLVVDVVGRRLDVGGPRPGPGETVWVPFVDVCSDSVVFSVPHARTGPWRSASGSASGSGAPMPPISVSRGGRRTVVDTRRVLRPPRMMIVQFAIQGLNDLFEVPEDAFDGSGTSKYSPPLTYAQISVRDREGLYSSRPLRRENGDPDGYAYAWDAQRAARIPTQWAMNAGLLLLLAHDCPDELARLRQDVDEGLVRVGNAGFGAHRPPYYDAATNLQELLLGEETLVALLGRCEGLYYPDQRMYKAHPAEVAAYAAYARRSAHSGPFYLVLDRSTVCEGTTQCFPDGTSGTRWTDTEFGAGNRLWRDPRTGYLILLIEDDLRNRMLNQSHEEVLRGKLALDLRRMFMKALSDTSAQPVLMVYSDDGEKSCGNGWFDVTVDSQTQQPLVFTNRYQAALAWFGRHPWVQVVTTADLDRDPGGFGDLVFDSATCPSVDPGGASNTDVVKQNRLHFDTWHEWWAAEGSPWLGVTLAKTLEAVERPLLATRASDVHPDLLPLAWKSYLLSTHEQFWSTQPLEGGRVNVDPRRYPPEDFVITESLQMRNALVYLNAARWAKVAVDQPDAWTHVDEGWLLRAVPGRHWDGDLLPNVLVYNREVLLVLDRNGGAVTHVFTRRPDGRAFCVSGTPKCYQWFGPPTLHLLERPRDQREQWLSCDGHALQNTVWTPNHAYVAADPVLARPRPGTKDDFRAEPDGHGNRYSRWLFANNFDEYEGSICGADAFSFVYQESSGSPPPQDLTMDAFRALCEEDRAARRAGRPPIVWHDDRHVGFRKTIRLSGRTISISYEGVRPGHVVSNEFSVHVAAALRGQFHRKDPAPDGTSVTLRGADGVNVRVTPVDNCRFTPEVLFTESVTDPILEMRRLRLHRVLTDNLELTCAAGGDFSYRIDL